MQVYYSIEGWKIILYFFFSLIYNCNCIIEMQNKLGINYF